MSYTTPTAVTYTVDLEVTYDWQSRSASIPMNLSISKVTKFGKQLVSLSVGARYWLQSTPVAPEGFGLRAQIVLLFPK